MWNPFAARKGDGPGATADLPPAGPRTRRRKGRRGATTMEYAVMISFVLLVCIAVIQGFGINVGKIFTGDAAATSKAQPPGK